MKNLRRFATIMLVVVLSVSLAFSTFAAFENVADELNELGLFRGVGENEDGTPIYSLDRAPTRAEAIVMLVRFLGMEEEALEAEIEHPFTDVPEWADPHVALAFKYGFTLGTSETHFGSASPCTAQAFTTFMLRALGYNETEDGGDIYAVAINMGKELKIIDSQLASGVFLRDKMVVVAYLALFAAPAEGEFDSLLAKLVEDGAVDADAAAAFLDKDPLYELVEDPEPEEPEEGEEGEEGEDGEEEEEEEEEEE